MRVLLLFFLISTLLYSCSDDQLIEIEGLEELEMEWCGALAEHEFLINSDLDYEVFQIAVLDQSGCSGHSFPQIDFETKTLIGRPTEIVTCNLNSNLSVFADPEDDQYIYKQELFPSGDCTTTFQEMYFVSIPKMPDGYTVRYDISTN